MADQMNMDAAQKSYNGFIKFMKWGTVATAIATLIVVLLVASLAN